MDVSRLLDVWQVFLQEPRMVDKETTLLLQNELSQQVARDVLEKQAEDTKKRVEKSNHAEKDEKISGDKKRQSQKEKRLARAGKRKRKSSDPTYTHKNIISKDRIDTVA